MPVITIKENEGSYKGYLVAEILRIRYFEGIRGGADWFYSLPKHDALCHSADKIFNDYKEAVKYGNIFSINVGPDYDGKIRDIDVKTLKEVGENDRGVSEKQLVK